MRLKYHTGLTEEKWFSKPLSFQLANIGSEVSRTFNWLKKRQLEAARLAFERGLELFDLTVDDPKNRTKLKEILRSREVFAANYLDSIDDVGKIDDSILKYFDQFAFLYRNQLED